MRIGFAAAARAFEEGRFDDAVAALASALGRPWRPERTLALRLKPSQDLLYARHWREDDEGRSDRRAWRLADAAVKLSARDGVLRALRGALRLYTRDLDGSLLDLDAALALKPAQPWARAWRFAALTLAVRRDSDLPRPLRSAPHLDRPHRDDPTIPPPFARGVFTTASFMRPCATCVYYRSRATIGRCPRGRNPDRAGLARAPLLRRLSAIRRGSPYAMRPRRGQRRSPRSLKDSTARQAVSGLVRVVRPEARPGAWGGGGGFADFDCCLLDPATCRARSRVTPGSCAASTRGAHDLDRAVCADCRRCFFTPGARGVVKLGRLCEAAADFDRCHPFHPRLSDEAADRKDR